MPSQTTWHGQWYVEIPAMWNFRNRIRKECLMRWVSDQESVPGADELLAMDWGAIGLLVQQQSFDAVIWHQRDWLKPHETASTSGSATESGR